MCVLTPTSVILYVSRRSTRAHCTPVQIAEVLLVVVLEDIGQGKAFQLPPVVRPAPEVKAPQGPSPEEIQARHSSLPLYLPLILVPPLYLPSSAPPGPDQAGGCASCGGANQEGESGAAAPEVVAGRPETSPHPMSPMLTSPQGGGSRACGAADESGSGRARGKGGWWWWWWRWL